MYSAAVADASSSQYNIDNIKDDYFFFLNEFWPTKFRPLTETDPRFSLCEIHIREFNHSAYSHFFFR